MEEDGRWADDMDRIDQGLDDGLVAHRPQTDGGGGGDDDDLLRCLLAAFPVPGEIYVHLCTGCHYLSSLLEMHPPAPGDVPYVVQSPGRPPPGSPFRIHYGVANPAVRGTVVASNVVVPNFAWTPRLVVAPAVLRDALAKPCPRHLLVLPAVRGPVVRLFHDNGQWYVADSVRLECLRSDRPPGPLARMVDACVRTYHHTKGLLGLTTHLRPDRVWFFAVFPDQAAVLGLGTCRLLSHYQLGANNAFNALDHGYSVHGDVAPSIPILPAAADVALPPAAAAEGNADGEGEEEEPFDAATMRYRGLFDGVILVNPMTLFAVRLCSAAAFFLAPLLRDRQTVPEFLLQTALTSVHVEPDRPPSADPASLEYWTVTQPALAARFFAADHDRMLRQVDSAVCNVYHWLSHWMHYTSTLSPDEWRDGLPLPLQRLYVVLEHETPPNWHRVVCNPRYQGLVAKALAQCLPDYV
jgi:hypothetical protein